MKKLRLLLALVAGCLVSQAVAERVKLDISWSLDPKTENYTNNQTKIVFPKSIAGFAQKRATPANKDGSASFAYAGKHGIITVYLTHRLILGLPGSDDCTPRFRENFLKAMREAHGKTDMDELFSFSFVSEGKSLTGLGATAHFVSSPQLGGPVYSEFGAVLVGDFIYYYRASFPEKVGLKELAAFLLAIDFKGRANQPVQTTTTAVTPAAAQPARQP